MLDPEPVRLSIKLKLRAESEVFRIVLPSAVVVVKQDMAKSDHVTVRSEGEVEVASRAGGWQRSAVGPCQLEAHTPSRP